MWEGPRPEVGWSWSWGCGGVEHVLKVNIPCRIAFCIDTDSDTDTDTDTDPEFHFSPSAVICG
jgi:hypothetical protein